MLIASPNILQGNPLKFNRHIDLERKSIEFGKSIGCGKATQTLYKETL